MGVSVVRFSRGNEDLQRWGVLRGELVHEVPLDTDDHRAIMHAFHDEPTLFTSDNSTSIRANDVVYQSPVKADVQLCCQGLNYADHREESGQSSVNDEENLIFLKAASSICAPNEAIVRPKGVELLDYEVELGLILKRDLERNEVIKEEHLPQLVGGWVLCNDVSARDMMFGAPMLQWFKGKSQRTFCPLGPVLFLPEEQDFQHLYELELRLWLNGELRQESCTRQLIHKPAKTFTELSEFMDLHEGDCLLTGTPGGVLAGTSLKTALAILLNFGNDKARRRKFTQAQQARNTFMQPGDKLELEISTADRQISLGRQQNVIVDA